jgi:8-oxo-dGTP pyrophosphatase MutT (NUDIX family)
VTERIKTVLAVYLLLEKDGRYLFLRRQNSGWQDGRYTVPAGHVDADESATTAMVRETEEEIGVKISVVDLELVHVMHRNDRSPYIDVYFRCGRWSGRPEIKEPHKADDLRWASPAELSEQLVPTVALALRAVQDGRLYSEDAWDVQPTP